MPKNIVVCCDGTNNQFGSNNTNVVRLVQSLPDEPTTPQVVFYDPGIGTLPEAGTWSAFAKRVSEWRDLAFATTLNIKIERAYTFLMNTWKPGDAVYLFGFSRGAYTVRALAGLLHATGLLHERNENLVSYLIRLYAAIPDDNHARKTFGRYLALLNQFRQTFARPIPRVQGRRFPVRFLGLWDTVSSVGWVWDPKRLPFTRRNPSVQVIRHAISIDERRAFFRQNRISAANPEQDCLERWFAGVHSDVGGGYDEKQGGLWQPPFRWIVEGAVAAGLQIGQVDIDAVLRRTPLRENPELGQIHNQLKRAWWPAEFFPKKAGRGYRMNFGRRRNIEPGEWIHQSALNRIAAGAYKPRNLSPRFVDEVQRRGPHTSDQQYQL